MNHAAVTKAMHQRGTFFVAVVLNIVATVLAYFMSADSLTVTSEGFVSGWGLGMTLPREVSLGIAVAVNAAIVALLLNINKTYNLLRTMTHLHGALFLIILLATPTVLLRLTPGALLCLGILVCLALMYVVYVVDQRDMRKVFLVFFILSGCSSFDYAFALYVPIFILACFQLRIFSLRCALAIVMGLASPWILFFGFGIVDIAQMQLPLDTFGLPSLGDLSTAIVSSTVFLTAFITIGALLQNVIKIITYNAQSRSMLSVVTTITIITVILALVDISNVYSYITLLDLCAAFQLAHLFLTILNFAKSYFVILSIALIYILIFAWNLVISTSW